MAALVMQVNGFQFQGMVYIALGEGSDYYRIYGEKDGATKEYNHDIAFDELGYYRLSAYMHPLLKTPKTLHLYKAGATFNKVMMLYRFDKKLRLLMFNEIENYLCNNRIRHASHLNSEPGRVFCFYGNIKIIH